MLEWLASFPDWVQSLWFIYVTFHDFIQWGIITAVGFTAWGQKRQRRKVEREVQHIHEELHKHIEEDSTLHKELGQDGMSKGK